MSVSRGDNEREKRTLLFTSEVTKGLNELDLSTFSRKSVFQRMSIDLEIQILLNHGRHD